MSDLKWEEFERVDLRIGTIVNAEIFEEAIKSALKLEIDFGASIGVKKSSAQITDHYDPSDIIGKGPAPWNMEVPKYEFVNANTIKIG